MSRRLCPTRISQPPTCSSPIRRLLVLPRQSRMPPDSFRLPAKESTRTSSPIFGQPNEPSSMQLRARGIRHVWPIKCPSRPGRQNHRGSLSQPTTGCCRPSIRRQSRNISMQERRLSPPAKCQTQEIQTDGATIHVRVGGQGPAVVLLHGFGDTGDMWALMAAELAHDHRVVVPDLRGMGLSSHPAGGYEKKTQAADIRSVLTQLGIDHAAVVGLDIGATVAYAYAARYPDKTDRLVVMDAPVPGIPPWDEIVRSPSLWHFSFGGPDAERLVAGRERIYLDRFWNEFAGDPSKIDEATRVYYTAFYARPGAMRSAFAQFLSIPRDAEDNKASMTTKLTMPVLAIGGAKAFGANVAIVMRNAADNVTEVLIANSGHWLMDEQPTATIAAVHNFLDRENTTQSY